MDFDSLVTIVFIIVFFILPSIFKQIRAKKRKAETPKKAERKPSFFSRISSQIQDFVQELEQQVQEQRQAQKEADTVWDTFEEKETLPPRVDSVDNDADFYEPEPVVYKKSTPLPVVEKPVEKVTPKGQKLFPEDKKAVTPALSQYSFRSNPLQNAIIWSEILGKPIALRDE